MTSFTINKGFVFAITLIVVGVIGLVDSASANDNYKHNSLDNYKFNSNYTGRHNTGRTNRRYYKKHHNYSSSGHRSYNKGYSRNHSYGYRNKGYSRNHSYGYRNKGYSRNHSYGYRNKGYSGNYSYGYRNKGYSGNYSYGYRNRGYSGQRYYNKRYNRHHQYNDGYSNYDESYSPEAKSHCYDFKVTAQGGQGGFRFQHDKEAFKRINNGSYSNKICGYESVEFELSKVDPAVSVTIKINGSHYHYPSHTGHDRFINNWHRKYFSVNFGRH